MSARTLEPTFRHALRVWWAFTWRSFLAFWVIVIPFGLLVALLRALGLGAGTASKLASTLAWPIIIAAQVEALRRVLKLDFKTFQVRLLEPPRE